MSSTPPKPSEGSIQSTPPSKDTPSKKRRRELAPLDTNLDGNDDVEMGMGMAMPPSNTPAVSPQQGAGVVPQSNLQPYRQLPSTGQWKSSHVNSIDEMLHASGSKKPISEESEGNDLKGGEPQRAMKRARVAFGGTTNIGDSAGDASPTNHPNTGVQEPDIDEYTRLLGIGWSRVSGDPDFSAAINGWTRYIENYYPLNHVEIMLKSKSADGFLVKTIQGYYLFQEDMKKGKLVARDHGTTMLRLQGPEIQFEEDEDVLEARSPSAGPSHRYGQGSAEDEQATQPDESMEIDG